MASSIQEQLADRLVEGMHCKVPSVTARLPFPYHWIPGRIRLWLSKLVFRKHVLAMRREPNRVPSSYWDDSAHVLMAQLSQGGARFCWPDNKKCALVLSHDVDTPSQEEGIATLVELAQKRDLLASYNFVGEHLGNYHRLIVKLKGLGFEVGLHDITHDNQIAFLSVEEIRNRLLPLSEMMKEYSIRGFRSPSWYASPNLWRALATLGFDYDMSSIDSWSFFDEKRNYGVGCFFPYRVGELNIIPNTIPFEAPLFMGYQPQDHFSFWRPKLDYIAQSGGLIMFNAHPDSWYCGNKKMARALEQCVDYVLEKYDPARLKAGEVSSHLRAQIELGNTTDLGGKTRLQVPSIEKSLVSPPSTLIPTACKPRDYLKGVEH